MQKGLEGRRIAVFAADSDAAAEIRKELTAAGAIVSDLPASGGDDTLWHGGLYAGLVLVGGDDAREPDDRLRQLVREFMVSEKPVAAFAVDVEAFQLDESLLAAQGWEDPRGFAQEVVAEFSELLEEHAVDEMSDLSFPASDPPAVSPGIPGHISPDRDARG